MPRLPSVGGDNNDWGNILNEFLQVSHTSTGRNKFVSSVVSFSTNITFNSDTADIFTVSSLTNNTTIANPTGAPVDGQLLILRFSQDATGGRTISWGSDFSFQTPSSSPQIPNLPNARWEMSFRWNDSTDKWELVNISSDESVSQSSLAFSSTISFNVLNGNMAPYTVSGAIAFTPEVTNAITWSTIGLRLTADGTNIPTFPGFQRSNSSQSYVNTNGTVNVVLFWFDGVEAWYSIYQSATSTLSVPGSFSATASGQNQISLSWSDVANEVNYEIQRSPNGSTGWSTINQPSANSTSYNNTGLSASTQYFYRIRALGDGISYSHSGWATANATTDAPDVTAPVISTSTIENSNKDRILLTYGENLDTGSVPSTSDYSVLVNSVSRSVTNVGISGAVVTVTLASACISSDVITLSYTPGASPVQDAAGNDSLALSNRSITNNISSYDSDAEAYFTAEETAASIVINNTNKQAISDLITSLKSDGVWTKIKSLHLGYGTGLINAKSPGTLNATAPNGLTINSFGYTFNGTNQYLNTNIIPSVDLGDSSESYAFYLKANTDDRCLLGVSDAANISYIFPRSAGTFAFRIQTAGDLSGGSNPSAVGTYVVSRRTGESIRVIKNGTQIYSNTVGASSPTTTYKVVVGAFNNQNSFSSYNAATLGLIIIGTEFTNTEMGNINTRINSFISATSRT